ncbi:RICIN domain-containing protein [Nonomuraea sp. NPDC001023]|uniref:RICIN domain-containing protein n=1 Tax=unclassified Nonomuraea TaxID=2593643 RepID=UPI003328E011
MIFLKALSASLLFFVNTSPAFAGIDRDGPSTYLTNRYSGLDADFSIPSSCYIPDNAACPNGTPIALGPSREIFGFHEMGDGWKEVKWFGDYCLDAEAAGTANGTKVILWQCHGGPNQLWIPRIFVSGDPDTKILVNRNSGKCLDADNPAFPAPPKPGARLQLWDCIGSTSAYNAVNQDWKFEW